MEIVSPSGRVYKWAKDTPPTQGDIDSLQAFDAAHSEQQDAQKKKWADAGVVDHAKMLSAGFLERFIPKAKETAVQLAKQVPVAAGTAGGLALGGPPGAAAGGGLADYGMQQLGVAIGSQKEYRPGQTAGAMIAGAIPGAGPGRAAIGNTIAGTAQTAIDQQRLPTASELAQFAGSGILGAGLGSATQFSGESTAAANAAQTGGTEMKQTLKAMRDVGYVAPPSFYKPSISTKTLESFGGKADTIAETIRLNQPKTNNAIREELGLQRQEIKPEVSFKELNSLDAIANKPFAKVAGVSEDARVLLDAFRSANDKARLLFSQNRNQYSKETLDAARAAEAEAGEWFSELKKELTSQGKPELFDELNDARVQKAKIALVREATNRGTGNVDASVIGRALDQGEKITGNLAKVGRVQQAFANIMKDASAVAGSGVNNLRSILSGAGAAGGYAAGGYGGAILGGGVPFLAPWATRNAVLSSPVQRFMNPAPLAAGQPNFQSSLIRFATQNAGR